MRFPEFKDNWQENELGKFCKVTMGQSPDSNSYNNDGIGMPLVQGNADMKNRITVPQRYSSEPTKVVDKDAIILSVRAPVGTVGRSNQKVCLGRGVCGIVCGEQEFMYQYLLKHENSWKNIEQGGTFTAINSDDIKSFKIYVPTKTESTKIAKFLSLVDERIEQQRQLVEALKRYKRGYFQQIISSLDTTEFDVADVVKEYTEKTQTQNEYPILSSTLSGIQLQNSYFNKQAASENTVGYKIVPYGCFTYRSMSDTGDFHFNLQTIIDKGIVSPAYPVFSVCNDHESEFIEYILNETDKIKNQLRIKKEGGTRYALSFAKFKSLTICLPTKQQQQNFVKQLRLFNDMLNKEETIYTDLQKYKTALLQQMFV